MKIKDYNCKCGHNDFFFADKGNQKGIYCSYCGKWLKWADKDEQNLPLKQEFIIDKIRAEIETEKNAGCHTWYAAGLDFAMSIIDKYKAGTVVESEEV